MDRYSITVGEGVDPKAGNLSPSAAVLRLIDDKLLGLLPDGQIARLHPFEDLVHIPRRPW